MNEPKLVRLQHDPTCIWCAANLPPDLAQLDYGRLRLIPSATPTAYSQPDTATPADPSATSGTWLKTSCPAKADPTGASSTTGTVMYRELSSALTPGEVQRHTRELRRQIRTASDARSRGGLTQSSAKGSAQEVQRAGRHAGTQEAGDD